MPETSHRRSLPELKRDAGCLSAQVHFVRLRERKDLTRRPAFLAGSIKRDAIARFSLRDASFKADDISEDSSENIIEREVEMKSYWRCRIRRASLPHCADLNTPSITRRGLGHVAVVLSSSAAAGRQIRLCRSRGKERRDKRQAEHHQQRDGDNAAHERPDK